MDRGGKPLQPTGLPYGIIAHCTPYVIRQQSLPRVGLLYSIFRGVCSCQNCQTILDNHCLRRPDSVQLSTVPATLQKVIGSGDAFEGMWIGTFPRRANASPTTFQALACVYAHLHTGLASHYRGVPPRCFSQATSSRSGRMSPPFGGLGLLLPAELSIEAMVEIDTGIVVGIRFIAAGQTSVELSPTRLLSASGTNREPLSSRPASAAPLRRLPRIDLNGDHTLGVHLLTGDLIDLSPQLIGLLAIESSGFTASFWFDLA